MEQKKTVIRGEAALALAVVINSLGVLLMLHSGSGISAISSVPYAFQLVLPKLTLGTWTYLLRNCAFKPLQASDYSNGLIPAGALRHYRSAICKD